MASGGGGYAAILARLRAPQLRLHCDEALRIELLQTQLRLQDVCAAMQRLRDVGQAAKSLGSDDGAAPAVALLLDLEKTQRDLSRAIAAFGSPGNSGGRAGTSSSSSVVVCCKCGCVENATTNPGDEWDLATEEPLLAKPNAAALSPPRRRKPTPLRTKAKSKTTASKHLPKPRRKLVIPRKTSPDPEEEDEEEEGEDVKDETKGESPRSQPAKSKKRKASSRPKKGPESPITKEEDAKTDVKTDESDGVVIVEDTPETEDEDDDEDADADVRVRLQHKIDACWPLATSLGALEMPQRRRADYADLVRRVIALFRTLLACDVESMASRSMRSVLVKARDSLAVAVSLLSLHDVTDTNARVILALVKAVDAASEKHPTLQKHVAPFRNSLADFEVALLTRTYAKLSQQQPPVKEMKGAKKKARAGP